MGCDEDVVVAPQRVFRGQHLGVGHVEHRPDPARLTGQCLLVDHRAAGGVDQHGVVAQQAEQLAAHQSPGLRRQRRVHADHVTALEQLPEAHELGTVHFGHERIVHQHVEIVGSQQLDHPAADHRRGQDPDGRAEVADRVGDAVHGHPGPTRT